MTPRGWKAAARARFKRAAYLPLSVLAWIWVVLICRTGWPCLSLESRWFGTITLGPPLVLRKQRESGHAWVREAPYDVMDRHARLAPPMCRLFPILVTSS
jgi:hypothetical protein